MTHRIKTIAVAVTASALTMAGMAFANGGGHDKGFGPFGWGGKSLTYSETHFQRDGEDETLRVDQGRVVTASATGISIERNDGETVDVPIDDDTKVWGGWWHKRGASVAHRDHGERKAAGVDGLPAGKRVLVVRSDDDEAAEAVTVGWRHGHFRGHDRDRDDD
jgi:hypothetical protein